MLYRGCTVLQNPSINRVVCLFWHVAISLLVFAFFLSLLFQTLNFFLYVGSVDLNDIIFSIFYIVFAVFLVCMNSIAGCRKKALPTLPIIRNGSKNKFTVCYDVKQENELGPQVDKFVISWNQRLYQQLVVKKVFIMCYCNFLFFVVNLDTSSSSDKLLNPLVKSPQLTKLHVDIEEMLIFCLCIFLFLTVLLQLGGNPVKLN